MKYTDEVYALATAELNERLLAAQREKSLREEEIAKNYPEIARINDSLKQSVAEIARAMSSVNFSSAINMIAKTNLSAQKQRGEMLKAYGFPENYLDEHYTCNDCRDTGSVLGHRCRCFDELLQKYAIIESNKSCRIALKDFDDFDLGYYEDDDRDFMRNTLEMCQRYAEEFSSESDSLFFFGGTGLGKTLLSSAIAKVVINRGFNVVYDSISNLLRKVEEEHFGRADGGTMELLLKADLVILDDLGSEFKSGFNDSAINDIIDSRINYGLPTIISSNMSFKELNSRYNERIVSRLGGIFIPVRFRGKDIRMQKRMMQ